MRLRSVAAVLTCLDTTAVPVEGTMTVADAAGAKVLDRAAVKGQLLLGGLTLREAQGQLDLQAAADNVFFHIRDGKTFVACGGKIGHSLLTPAAR